MTDAQTQCPACGGSCIPPLCDYPGLPPVETTLQCLDAFNMDECSGSIEYRMPLSGTGKSFPRCDGHWDKRLDVQAGIDARYPDSPFPPPGFDESYAGERWNDDY